LAVLEDVQGWLMVVLAERGGGSLEGLHRKSCEFACFVFAVGVGVGGN